MAKEVRIHLTPAQKAKIKSATGRTMGEIRVSPVGKNLSAKFSAKPTMLSAKPAMRGGPNQISAKHLARNVVVARVAARKVARLTARNASRLTARQSAKLSTRPATRGGPQSQ